MPDKKGLFLQVAAKQAEGGGGGGGGGEVGSVAETK